MKEKLTCATCNKNWHREKTRGRKPHQCPKCVKAEQKQQTAKKTVVDIIQVKKNQRKVIATPIAQASSQNAENNQNNKELSVGQIFNYYHPSDQKLKEETKGGSTWKCKRCGYTLTVKLSLTAVPTHKCTENSRSYPMERI